MADGSITISSVLLTQPTRDEVGETTALIPYTCSATLNQAQGHEETYTKTVYVYNGNFEYEWTIYGQTFYEAGGLAHITGLAKGMPNDITGNVKVTYRSEVKEFYTRQDRYEDVIIGWEGNTPIKERQWVGYTDWVLSSTTTSDIVETQEANPLQPVWTRPGLFTADGGGWLMSKDVIIQSPGGLSAAWTQLWALHMNKIGYWYQQQQIDVAGAAIQPSNEFIRASWYNICANLINVYTNGQGSAGTVKGGREGTIISAEIINVLANNNKSCNEV